MNFIAFRLLTIESITEWRKKSMAIVKLGQTCPNFAKK